MEIYANFAKMGLGGLGLNGLDPANSGPVTLVKWQGGTYVVFPGQTESSARSEKGESSGAPILSGPGGPLPQTLEIVTWLNHYLTYWGHQLKLAGASTYLVLPLPESDTQMEPQLGPEPLPEHQPGPQVPAPAHVPQPFSQATLQGSLQPHFTQDTPEIATYINQFRLFLRSGLPLTHSNLRQWFQYWQESGLVSQVAGLLEHAAALEQVPPVPSEMPADEVTAFDLDPLVNISDEISEPHSRQSAKAETGDKKPLQSRLANLAEQVAAEKMLNTILEQSNLAVKPVYFQFPLAHGGRLYQINVLFVNEESKKEPSRGSRGIRVAVEIPTAHLGLVIGQVVSKDDRLSLTITASSRETAEEIKANLPLLDEISRGLFQSIGVDWQDCGDLRPKQRLLHAVFGQGTGSIDVRV